MPLSASLLVPTSGSDTVVSGSVDDAVFGPFALNFSFSFYGGAPVTQVNLSSNGNLQFGTMDAGYANRPFPDFTPMVAPFWEDLLFPSGDLRYNNTVAHQFTAIWSGAGLFLAPGEVNAEAILLGPGNGFGYAANSIIFSYGIISNTKDNSITVGLTDGATLVTCMPGSAVDCTFTQAQALLLQDRSFLFTPVIGAAPGYTVSELSGVPEPSGFVLGGLGLALLGVLSTKVGRGRS
jgi:hypothetical protein